MVTKSERERDAWRGVEHKERGEKARRSTTRRHSFMSRSAETSAVAKGDSASTDAESTDAESTSGASSWRCERKTARATARPMRARTVQSVSGPRTFA
jgi:hypothetical protein